MGTDTANDDTMRNSRIANARRTARQVPKRRLSRAAAIVAAVMALAAGGLLAATATASPASADTGPSLALGHGSYGAWSITGQGFAQGRTDVQVWVMDTTNGGWSTLEHQANLTTSTFQFGPCTKVTLCLWRPGGLLSATGAVSAGVPGGFGPYAQHPLQCGRSYRPVAYDAVDGYVYGPTLSEACPVLH